MRRLLPLFLIGLFLNACSTPESDTKPSRLVLTSLAPLHQLTLSLTLGTNIRVENLPSRPRSMASQPTFFARQGENFITSFQQADAVISASKAWKADPLYTSAREHNIRIVNIDASQPWSNERDGVALASSPASGEISPFFWTGPSNMVRIQEIIAFDLAVLYPDQRELIEANLKSSKAQLLTLKSDIENRLLTIEDPVIYALTDELVSLSNELGLYVDGYFIKQDIDWTQEDLEALSSLLRDHNIPVVIHKWMPSEKIQQAIISGGATLAILDPMELSNISAHDSLFNNTEALLQAFE